MSLIRTPDECLDYFREIVESARPSGRSSQDRILYYEYEDQAVGNNMKYPAFIMLPVIAFVSDHNDDDNEIRLDWEFWMTRSVNIKNYAERKIARQLCFKQGWDILSKIDAEAHNFNPATSRIVTFNRSSIKIDEIGPIGADNAYGYAFAGSIQNPRSLYPDPDIWA